MSLRVWLPLDGNLQNQGISNATATGHSIISTAAGKIGSCYQFTTSAIELDDNIFDNNVTEFTVAAWMKFNNSNSACLFSDRAAVNSTGITLFIMDNGKIYYDAGARWEFTPSTAIPRDQWFHIAFLYKKGSLRQVYLNGSLIGSTTSAPAATTTSTGHSFIGASQNSSTTLGGNYFNGWMNDVRIYDHCLSAAEVHEIAQGLVLHYKLDASSEEKITTIPSTNVYSYPTFNTSTAGGGWYHWGPSGHSGSYGQNTDKKYIYNKNNTYSHWITENAETEKYYLLYQSPAFEGGYRSLQAIIKEENSLPITESICYPGWNARNGGVPNNKWTSIKFLGDGFYYCCCEGVSQDGSNDLIGINVKPGYKIYVSECYLENNTETCSPIFTYSSNIVQDSSGYGHNATLTNGSLTINTPRYSGALILDSSTKAIGTPIFKSGVFIPEYTWAGWIKRNYTTASSKQIHANIANINLYSDFTPYLSWTSGKVDGSTTGNGAAGGTKIATLNEWVHMAITYKGGIGKFYINGELIKTFNYSSYGIYIAAAANNTLGNGFIGNLSDIRIYVTQLLDTDIKQLYNTSMKIDSSNKVHTFELNEQKNNIFFPIELSRSNLTFNNGLSRYTQTNCQVTLTEQGLRIYRPPNVLNKSAGGTNNMYGGLKLVNQKTDTISPYDSARDNTWNLQKGHTYLWTFHVSGQTTVGVSPSMSHNLGNGVSNGVAPSPTILHSRGIPANFIGEQDCYYMFTINDDLIKTSNKTNGGYQTDSQYLSYRHFTFTFAYSSTGELGTDLYLTNFQLYDVTSVIGKILRSGEIMYSTFVENNDIAKIRKGEEFLANEFIER